MPLPRLFSFNDTAPSEPYPLSLHDALPISSSAIPVAGRRNPPRCTLFFCGGASSPVGPGPPPPSLSREPQGTQLTVNQAKSKGTTPLSRERCLPAQNKSLPVLNFRAGLLDASLEQFGLHFGLLPGKKPHFGFKCPVSWQRDLDAVFSGTHR